MTSVPAKTKAAKDAERFYYAGEAQGEETEFGTIKVRDSRYAIPAWLRGKKCMLFRNRNNVVKAMFPILDRKPVWIELEEIK